MLLARCDGCARRPIASLTQAQGNVSRDYAAKVGHWEPAPVGAELRLGDGIQLQGAGIAVLDLGGGTSLSMQPNTLIRLLSSDVRGPFAVKAGEAVLQVGTEAYELETELGLAVLSPNSQARVLRQGPKVVYKLDVGSAYFEHDGRRFKAEVGDAILMGGSAFAVELKASRPRASHAEPPRDPAPTESAGAIELWLPADGVLSRAPSEADFVALPRGRHPFASGSTLRLKADQSARASRGQDTVALRGRGDFIVNGDVKSPMVSARAGLIDVEATQQTIEIRVPGGTIIVEAPPGGGRARITASERATTVHVERGRVQLQDASGRRALYGGEQGALKPGAELPRGPDEPPRDLDELPRNQDELSRSQEEAEVPLGPERCDVPLERARLLTLHAATVPVVVGLPIPECDGQGVVKVQRSITRGVGQAHVTLGPGRHSYRAHCMRDGKLSRARYQGVVQVLHDSGTRELPKKAPDTQVDIDGRLYTILYQNQPPQITVHWPQAAPSPSYRLSVERAGKRESFSTPSPTYAFPSGALRDGEHALTFVTATGQRSKTTLIDLGFDNAAPKASLFLPRQHGFRAGDTVQVEGVVLPGWKVALEGGRIDVDRQHRFHGEVTTSVDHPHVVLRLAHPKGGVHYYLRHAAP